MSTTTANGPTAKTARVQLHGVLRHSTQKDLRKLIEKTWKGHDPVVHGNIVKIKKVPGATWATVTLDAAVVNSKDGTETVPSIDTTLENFVQFVNDTAHPKENERGYAVHAKRGLCRDGGGDGEKEGSDGGGDDEDGEETDQNREGKRRKLDAAMTIKSPSEICDAIAPMWKQPYEEQLRCKNKEMVRRCAIVICKEIKKNFAKRERESKRNANVKLTPLYEWVKERKGINVKDILPSPQKFFYRNKIELTFGYRYEKIADASVEDDCDNDHESKNIKKIPSVGFMVSGWDGPVASPFCCPHVPSEFCGIAGVLDDFLSSSPLKPYHQKSHKGCWRVLTMRSSVRTKQCMVIVQHAPVDDADILSAEKDRLIKMLVGEVPNPSARDFPDPMVSTGVREEEKDRPRVAVTSIFFQEYAGVSIPPPDHPVQHSYGKEFLEERLGKCTFQISPGAFFQVNTEGAERLYKVVTDAIADDINKKRESNGRNNDEEKNSPDDSNKEKTAEEGEKKQNNDNFDSSTLLFDVCCGTGTIGLTAMSEGIVGKVVGVDISRPAILDARRNAVRNGMMKDVTKDEDSKNEMDKSIGADHEEIVRFIDSRAELVLSSETYKARFNSGPTYAIVDPAREGLHHNVIKALRSAEKIERLVYVSCNPTKTLTRDATMLCAPVRVFYFLYFVYTMLFVLTLVYNDALQTPYLSFFSGQILAEH
mmetsp:Transcript_22083/g.50467  ORF Transcript_22083/g.50467 Transcript_22083/m.50467 type:complete len:707 (-) Transcript_22083:269-2389(-)